MKIIKYFFEFICIISLFCIFKIIGLNNASALGGVLGRWIGPFFRSKNITKQNIKIGLGNLDKKKEEELGMIFTFFVLETILLARLMNINPFDQPAVEQVKIETRKILSR